jgi:hypothetical protein
MKGVYVIQVSEDGPAKIGYSGNVTGRMAQLQTAQSEPLRLRRLWPWAKMHDERRLHEKLSDVRLDGEWFRWNDEVSQRVDQLMSRTTNLPAPVAHTLPSQPFGFAWLQLPNNRKARVTSDKRISVFDALQAAGVKGYHKVWSRFQESYPQVLTRCQNHVFPDGGNRSTPVTNREGLLEIFALLPGKPGDQTRHILIDRYTKYLDGDISMIGEMIDRQNDVVKLAWVEKRVKSKITQKGLMEQIKSQGGEGGIYPQVNAANNIGAFGATAREIKHVGGNKVTRDNDDLISEVYLQLLITLETVEKYKLQSSNAYGNSEIYKTVKPVADDIRDFRKRNNIPDVVDNAS